MTESYFKGGTTGIEIPYPRTLGQVFWSRYQHTLRFIEVEIYQFTTGWQPWPQLNYCYPDGTPWGGPLSTIRAPVTAIFIPPARMRLRFEMTPFEIMPNILYTIIMDNRGAPPGQVPLWFCNKGSGTYPRGWMVTPNPDGPGWVPDYDSDLMFAEYGWPFTPPEPLIPTRKKFIPTRIIVGKFNNGICINLHTDVPTKLTAYWTSKKTLTHKITRIERGLSVPDGARFCFVATRPLEQDEDWDTTFHKFILRDLVPVTELWWTVRGKIEDWQSPSVGPIFRHKFTGEIPIINPSFDSWAPDPPIFPWDMPYSWEGFFTPGKIFEWYPEPNIKLHGPYSLRLKAGAFAATTGVRQVFDATPYRNQRVSWKVSGRTSIMNANTRSAIDTDGTPFAHDHTICPVDNFAQMTNTVLVPPDATYIRATVQVHSPQYGPIYAYYDQGTFEV